MLVDNPVHLGMQQHSLALPPLFKYQALLRTQVSVELVQVAAFKYLVPVLGGCKYVGELGIDHHLSLLRVMGQFNVSLHAWQIRQNITAR